MNGPLTVYLAARYSRYQEMQGYARALQGLGCVITSRWIQGDHQVSDLELGDLDVGAEASQEKREQFAWEDVQDLRQASVMINFTEPPRAGPTRGGRHVEFGLAYAYGKKILVVGHRENVFHCLPGVSYFPVWEGALDSVRMMFVRRDSADEARKLAVQRLHPERVMRDE